VSEYILGISAYYHDSAAALIRDGELVAAVQEERFSRMKFDPSFPGESVRYILHEGGIGLDDVKVVAFYDKPYLKLDRLLETYHSLAPRGLTSYLSAMPVWMKQKLFMRGLLRKELQKIEDCRPRIIFPEHHLSHAASAFYPSPFEEAAILTIDGVGEWATGIIGHGRGKEITILRELDFPHSLGLLYSAFTYYCGFKVNSGEYKLMGLAPYGNAGTEQTERFKKQILEELIELKEDGSLLLNLQYFDFATGLTMCRDQEWEELFKLPRREQENKITQPYMDLAFAIQQVTEEVVLRLARTTEKLTGCENLVMAGGVALNCVANGLLVREKVFKELWIQPAAGDAGGALGAALAAWHIWCGKERVVSSTGQDMMAGAYTGPGIKEGDILEVVERYHASYKRYEDYNELAKDVAGLIAQGKIVGWVQGRMEWGPRALGNRSILADPRDPEMQKRLNLKTKYREEFRPFAPAVLAEDAGEYFDLDRASPYMLLVAPVKAALRKPQPDNIEELMLFEKLYHIRSEIPAVTHIDYSARIQTVHKETNWRFWRLLEAFKEETGIGVLINTSFNVRGEPIICTAEEAYRCFMRTDMDYLVIGDYLFSKREPFSENGSKKGVKGSSVFERYHDILCCPKCGEDIEIRGEEMGCSECRQAYKKTSYGVPMLFCPNDPKDFKEDYTETMMAFYSETPFPNYDDFDDVSSLIMKSRQSVFPKLLDEQIGFEKRILECGCGTGQLTNFLSIAHRTVIGTDVTLNSLRLGHEFKEKHGLERADFIQMNLFRPCFKPESFDLVICSGVLMTTADPFLGFQSIGRLVKPGGYIMIGLYHRYGRLYTDLRRIVFNLTNDHFLFLDKRNVDKKSSPEKRIAWFRDQYKIPHEGKHTIGQLFDWLEKENFRFIKSVPKSKPFEQFSPSEELFRPDKPGNSIERFIAEVSMIPSGAREGGFFTIIGKKRHRDKTTG